MKLSHPIDGRPALKGRIRELGVAGGLWATSGVHVVPIAAQLEVCRRKFLLELVDGIFELSIFHPYVLEFSALDIVDVRVVAMISIVGSIHAHSVVGHHHVVHVGRALYVRRNRAANHAVL